MDSAGELLTADRKYRLASRFFATRELEATKSASRSLRLADLYPNINKMLYYCVRVAGGRRSPEGAVQVQVHGVLVPDANEHQTVESSSSAPAPTRGYLQSAGQLDLHIFVDGGAEHSSCFCSRSRTTQHLYL